MIYKVVTILLSFILYYASILIVRLLFFVGFTLFICAVFRYTTPTRSRR